ncbi:autotransporter outer membrane beta-barrel domain-containing protein [Photobacterium sanguinicancri]|uniref:Autotransporter outer membrane beta-barrel domain-containing protein n=1 Tax=Photobacterium sanguinicancri TaxID=875932 RepID=A0AAW7XZS2_9GAMM|nr:autotransporter outer membrane beta-barrel domain-containing protein [Photobacterium sanguinicancri]MDO6541808.1 autotransporter outer membrane beta-barrel domain-containing protein [Photobacterium sanguinicancri]
MTFHYVYLRVPLVWGFALYALCAVAEDDISLSEGMYKAISSGLKGAVADFRHDEYKTRSQQSTYSSYSRAGNINNSLSPSDSSLSYSSTAQSTNLSKAVLYSDGGYGRKEQSRLDAYVRIDQDVRPNQSATNVQFEDGYAVTLGGDYLLNEHYLFGVALGLPYYQGEDNQADIDALMASGYFSYFQDNWYIDFSASYAVVDTDIERRISTLDNSPFSQQEKADSDVWVFSLGAGYLINHQHWDIAIESSLQHILSDTDRYTERPSRGNSNYLFSTVEDVNALGSSMLISGASFTYPFRTSLGLFQPYVRGYVHYDFDSGGQKIISQLQTEQYGSSLPIVIKSDDQVFGRVHVGMAGRFNNDWYGYVEASSLVGLNELDAQRFTVGIRIQLK